MKGGWLEHEIRSLPHVLACSVTPDDIVVLIESSADPVAAERAVQDVLRRSGNRSPVRVFGGSRPVFIEPVRVRSGRPALVGSVSGAVILAAGIWLAGASTGLRHPRSKTQTAQELAPPLARERVTVPNVGGKAPLIPLEPPPGPLLRPRRMFPAGGPIQPTSPGKEPPAGGGGPGPKPTERPPPLEEEPGIKPPPPPQPPSVDDDDDDDAVMARSKDHDHEDSDDDEKDRHHEEQESHHDSDDDDD
jgi:hypothetical protein